MKFWNRFVEQHPKAAQWIREGGLFLVFSYVVTAIKAVLLMFLPGMYGNIAMSTGKLLKDTQWMWPEIPVSMFGVDFKLAIVGNAVKDGGLAFTLANLTAIVFGECINFPLQRNVTFRSHGPLPPQILAHALATVAVFLVMNLFTCIWNPVAGALIANEALRNTVQSIVTTVVTGGVAMVIIFAVDKTIFSPGWGEKK